MPAARLPESQESALAALPTDRDALLDALRDALDREQQVELAGQLAWRYLDARARTAIGWSRRSGTCCCGKTASSTRYQMLEAGIALYRELAPIEPERANRVLVAVARYLAGHAPTSRSMLQTARTARRLARGDDLYAAID